MWVRASLTEAAADDNGNIFLSYVVAGERPVLVLDTDLNFIANAIDTVGHINRTIVVTGDGETMLLGSTWNGMGFLQFDSPVPGLIQHTFVDTFGVYSDVPACWEEINSAMGAEYAYVSWLNDCVPDTTFERAPLWVSALDLSPDESTLVVGTLTAGWGGPLGGANWLFNMEDLSEPYEIVGNWHNVDGSGEGVTDGPRGAAFRCGWEPIFLISIVMRFIIMRMMAHLFPMVDQYLIQTMMIGNKIMMVWNFHCTDHNMTILI